MLEHGSLYTFSKGTALFSTYLGCSFSSINAVTAYVIRSGRKHRIIHSFWSDDLFFHSPGNFSFSGHSDSTNFFHRFAAPSMSLSSPRNSSKSHSDLIPPHPVFVKKSTGDVWSAFAGNRSKKLSSAHYMARKSQPKYYNEKFLECCSELIGNNKVL